MILPLISRQQTALRSCRALALRRSSYNPKYDRRRLHNVPQLPHDQAFSQDGVGAALSASAYKIAWHEYQSHLVKRLNEQTVGTPYENKETRDILLATTRLPDQASLFNHASMAWNNHHFFTTISPTPRPISDSLQTRLSASFSSIESLQKEFIATAMGMFGPGFVWLIRNPNAMGRKATRDPEFTILCTYIAGSPLPGAHPRAQTRDLNVMNSLTGENKAGVIGPLSGSEDSKKSPGGLKFAHICMGVCTWEHVWMHDHGVATQGKRKYLEEWWKCIDWKIVEDNAALRTEQSSSISPRVYNKVRGH